MKIPEPSRSITAAIVLIVPVVLAQSCKRDDEEIKYPPPTPTTTVSATAEPVTSASASADAGPPADAAPVSVDPVTLDGLVTSVKTRAKKEAAGMKAEGAPVSAVLAEGASFEAPMMMAAGGCYAVVAQGGLGVTELDLQILAQPMLPLPIPVPATAIAVDTKSGPEAAISPCWKNATPLGFPAKLIITAKRGAGPVAAQIYVK